MPTRHSGSDRALSRAAELMLLSTPTKVRLHRVALALILFLAGATAAPAQEADSTFCTTPPPGAVDLRGLHAIYCSAPPAIGRPLRWVHLSARPVFYGAVPMAWGSTLLRDGKGMAAAWRLTGAQAGTYGVVLALKRLVGRPRPFVTRDLESRSRHYGRQENGRYASFPSGHAALSAAIVTSWGLSYPRWYVIGPGVMWATGVALSRLHLGVHYPSDVVVGAVLGIAIAGLIHHLRAALTPSRLRTSHLATSAVPVPIILRFRF